MKAKLTSISLSVATLMIAACTTSDETHEQTYTLHYDRPATFFEESLPLGNGQLGALVYGGIAEEHISLNDITLWTGEPDLTPWTPDAWKHLAKVRELLDKEDYAAAEEANKKLEGHNSEIYQALGTLHLTNLNVGEVSDYGRKLVLNDALAETSYTSAAGTLTRNAFVSAPDSVMVVKLTTTDEKVLSAEIKRRNVSSLSITMHEGVAGEDITVKMYNIHWTSYDGKTDMPVVTIDGTNSEYIANGSDTTYYADGNLRVKMNCTSDGATIYYTTNGTAPTQSSSSGTSIELVAGQSYQLRVAAWTKDKGMSDVVSKNITLRKGRITQNPCENSSLWADCTIGSVESTALGQTKSGGKYFRIGSSTNKVTTPVTVHAKGLSIYGAKKSDKNIIVAYQLGTNIVEDGVTTWTPVSSSWTTLRTISSTELSTTTMKRFEIALPNDIQQGNARFKISSSGLSTYVDDINYIEESVEQVSTPALSLSGGEVAKGSQVSITSTEGATIYYSINGGSYQTYTGAISITGPTTLLAYATKAGYADSWTAKAVYTVADVKPTLATPTMSIANGSVNWGTQVTIQVADAVATLHYSINGGTEQTTTGNKSISIEGDKGATFTVSAYLTRDGYTQSTTATGSWTIVYPQLAEPIFSAADNAGIALGAKVTISVETGASVMYTINGGNVQSAISTKEIEITQDMTIVAYAAKQGCTQSASVTRHYKVILPQAAAPVFDTPAGAVDQGTKVTITGQSGDTVYYSIDEGANWSYGLGAATVTITEACSVWAFVGHTNYVHSDTVKVTYTLTEKVQLEKPYFSIPEGTYDKNTKFSLNAEDGATIHYRIGDGDEQTAVTEVMLTLTEDMEISAYATKEGFLDSETITAAFFVKEVPTGMDEVRGKSEEVRTKRRR